MTQTDLFNTATEVKKYRFLADPGHAWLEVPMEELEVLGILDKVSGYSYRSRDGELAYLEEDCDAGLFIRTTGISHEDWIEVYEDPSTVRPLPGIKE